MYSSTTQIRVRYAETDQMKVVYYGNYATYFEVGRVELLRGLGFTYKAMEDEGIIMPVVQMSLQYIRSAKYDDLLTIVSSIPKLPTDHSITFHQQVLNEAGKLLTTGEVTLYFLEAATYQKLPMPSYLMDVLNPHYV
ncbi:MAG: acyl-CoA thioesterase [Bacteroidetes bacterium]|jgi:acyl-CoA thioester hydrolase|nr:MAG: acyl-CoA thioesterase [Bacteroidota bacterium]TAE58552.1 MAG: acyl-CoA thioesterase [Bacteroidota bacterium]TAF93637.1 MAG: acyl-CoA thioesterase [Bacteroidota bacterium]